MVSLCHNFLVTENILMKPLFITLQYISSKDDGLRTQIRSLSSYLI